MHPLQNKPPTSRYSQNNMNELKLLHKASTDTTPLGNLLVSSSSVEEEIASFRARIKELQEKAMVKSGRTSMNRAHSNASSKPPASTSEFCDDWKCTECERRKKAAATGDTWSLNKQSASKEHLPTLTYTKPLRPEPTLMQDEESYIRDTEDSFRLMMPLLNCEQEGCVRCYPAGIILPVGRITDTIYGALTWLLMSRTSDEHHLDMCRFQAERKCRQEWSSETHPACRCLKEWREKGWIPNES
jgi:hypothetical protein